MSLRFTPNPSNPIVYNGEARHMASCLPYTSTTIHLPSLSTSHPSFPSTQPLINISPPPLPLSSHLITQHSPARIHRDISHTFKFNMLLIHGGREWLRYMTISPPPTFTVLYDCTYGDNMLYFISLLLLSILPVIYIYNLHIVMQIWQCGRNLSTFNISI